MRSVVSCQDPVPVSLAFSLGVLCKEGEVRYSYRALPVPFSALQRECPSSANRGQLTLHLGKIAHVSAERRRLGETTTKRSYWRILRYYNIYTSPRAKRKGQKKKVKCKTQMHATRARNPMTPMVSRMPCNKITCSRRQHDNMRKRKTKNKTKKETRRDP